MGMIGGIAVPEITDPVDNLHGTFATMATSINNSQKVKVASSLSQLNGWTGAAYPDGTLVSINALSDGLDRGSLFLRVTGTWVSVSGLKITNLDTFVAAIKSYTSVNTWAGGTFYDSASGTFGIWIDAAGGYRPLVDSSWIPLTYPTGTKQPNFGYRLAYKLVAGGVMLRGSVQKTSGTFRSGQTILWLPEEATPAASMRTTVCGSTWSLANVQIGSDGRGIIYGIMNKNPSWFSWDGVFLPIA